MPPPSSEAGPGGGGHSKDDDESAIMEGPSASSPKSEAIAEDLQELSLQPESGISVDVLQPKTPILSERKNVLQLKLQQRRTREELVNQGIMPPLKSPVSFHEQRKSLERARTEDYLKRKIRCRPKRSELVRMHILEETTAEPSLQAKQLKLKRARLADDLNEKISQRPGPMELVVKNILPVETGLEEVLIDGDYAKVSSSSFDEDSSDALSPEQPASQESQWSIPSPAETKVTDAVQCLSPTQTLTWVQLGSEHAEKNIPPEMSQSGNLHMSTGFGVQANKSFPAIVKQNHSKPCNDKFQRAKKIKDAKPKAKKLKYHQYIPPDQKQKESPVMDSSYAKILQQQQLFLQLQILNQRQQHYNYQTILPAPPKPLHDQQATVIATTTSVRTLPTVSISTHCTSIRVKQNSSTHTTSAKPGPLSGNLDDMKVAELKQALKLRGLHVSGTKFDLIERLKASQDHSTVPVHLKPVTVHQPKPCEVIPMVSNVYAPSSVTDPSSLCSFSSTPPCSPCPSEVSVASADDVHTVGDSTVETVSSPVTQFIILPSPAPVFEKPFTDSGDKDIMLQEKDKQIEELTKQLKQKQELVERLKQQLEQEKRTQPPHLSDDQPSFIQVKQEIGQVTCDFSRCTESLNTRATVKQEPTKLQSSHHFLSSKSDRDESKINTFSKTQLVLTVNRPSTMHGEDNRSVILQVPSAKEASQLNTQPETEMTPVQPTLLDAQPKGTTTNDFFVSFIHNLDLSTECKKNCMSSVKQTSLTHNVENAASESELHLLPSPYTPDRLEDFLEASTGTKILQGDEDGTAMPLIDDLHSQMLSSLAILDHPTSSIDASDLHFSPEGDPLVLDISEPPIESMDWLELAEPPAMNLTPLSTATPSVFSTEFLDSHDLQLHWDSCL